MAESARASSTQLNLEGADPEVLAKIESQRAPGEYSPAPSLSDEKLDDGSLEKGSAGEASGAPALKRPTGFKVPTQISESNSNASSGHC